MRGGRLWVKWNQNFPMNFSPTCKTNLRMTTTLQQKNLSWLPLKQSYCSSLSTLIILLAFLSITPQINYHQLFKNASISATSSAVIKKGTFLIIGDLKRIYFIVLDKASSNEFLREYQKEFNSSLDRDYISWKRAESIVRQVIWQRSREPKKVTRMLNIAQPRTNKQFWAT